MKDLSYRDFAILKKNGKSRKISAPSRDLLKYQRNLMPFLEKEHKKLEKLHNVEWVQHGFIKDRNCVTAARQHIGFRYTICMDLSDFFDSCNTSHFEDNIKRYKHLFHKKGYCAQGFASSPILANIASLHMIKQINHWLLNAHIENEFEEMTKYAFTIYADDIQISTNDKSKIKQIIDSVMTFADHNGFKINKNKTRVRCSKAGYRKILGINVGNDHIRASRKTMRKIRAAGHQGNFHSKGGLTTWSKNLLPKALRKTEE